MQGMQVTPGPAQVEGLLVPNADGSYSRQGAIFHDQRMMQALQTGDLSPLRPMQDESGVPLAANAVLREDEYELFDRTVQNSYRDELVVYGDLASRGLTFGLGNAMGVTELKWEDVDEVSDAERSMYAGTQPTEDLPNFTTRRLPIPIISKGFHLDLRTLEAGRREGESLDVTAAEKCTRKVSENVDDLFANGGFSHAGIEVYGYTNQPQRNTGTLTAAWDGTATGAQIVSDTLSIVDAAYQDNVPGPYVLYIPYNYVSSINDDFKSESDKSIRTRMLEIEGLEAIRPTRRLSGEVVLVSMRREVVDAVVGFEPTLVQWETMGGMVAHFKVMSILVPRVKRDADGRSGIVHYSES